MQKDYDSQDQLHTLQAQLITERIMPIVTNPSSDAANLVSLGVSRHEEMPDRFHLMMRLPESNHSNEFPLDRFPPQYIDKILSVLDPHDEFTRSVLVGQLVRIDDAIYATHVVNDSVAGGQDSSRGKARLDMLYTQKNCWLRTALFLRRAWDDTIHVAMTRSEEDTPHPFSRNGLTFTIFDPDCGDKQYSTYITFYNLQKDYRGNVWALLIMPDSIVVETTIDREHRLLEEVKTIDFETKLARKRSDTDQLRKLDLLRNATVHKIRALRETFKPTNELI